MMINYKLRKLFVTAMLGLSANAMAQDYQMQAVPIQSRWAKDVGPSNALKEYPRPQLVRSNWQNLNGMWQYAITKKDAPKPSSYDGKILVPYPIESALSGVKKALQPTDNLWYKRTFNYSGKGKTLLHFGAVDFEATIFVNGKEAGKHTGGYTEFTFDVTALLRNGDNEIVVKVWDPSDQGYGPHGKQVLNPQNIYYTPTSGIWQTVWLETVPQQYIESLTITPDIDKKQVSITVHSAAATGFSLTAAGKTVKGKANAVIVLPVKDMHLWCPGDPYLYDLTVKLGSDEVKSYFGMRKSSIVKDEKGVDRIALNNKPYFNLGTLDQGFWPDGLYTAPTDEALAFDIKAIKAMGFNTIRKHIKVEPARWYYWADKLGMLVWQDFVNPNQGLPEGAKQAFEKQAAEEIVQLHNYPSITTWVLFNEKWGQYDQQRLTEWVKKTDPTRLVNGHTGELLYVNEHLRSPSPNAYVSADMTDVHAYPDPMMPVKQPGKAQVVGEFGGIGVFIPDHQWLTGSAWGYIQEKPAALKAKYTVMNQHLQLLQHDGLSGSIYTQPFDVEGEQNGLMTYDREVVKIPFAYLLKIHSTLNPDVNIHVPEVSAQDADVTEPAQLYSELLQQYIDGKRDAAFLKRLSQLAAQAGDKPGSRLAGNALVAGLKAPFSDEDIQTTSQFTGSTKDAGFTMMQQHADQFREVLGDRKYTVAMMNLIFKGELEPMINASDNPDWKMIEAKAKTFGAPGEEILLRAETVHFINHQDWARYVPAATVYLAKYGQNIPEEERNAFQQNIDQHK
ncbi:sugar-binding domain-containing protein [Mucilaginibacter sp. CAU 1740]|uniref:glycoside hydrolase family 2 protein n=1 Tax=Mucilaginibacter sp. CAU 1740 TaxID=3140365 RepID=UPI00325BBD49